jgi:hypothetical protein
VRPTSRWMPLLALVVLAVSTRIAPAQTTGVPVTASFSGLVYNRATQTFNSVLTLTNHGPTLYSPLIVRISTGSAAVTVAGAQSVGANMFALKVPISSGTLSAGGVQQIAVAFSDSTRVSFTPTVTSVSGAGPVALIDAPTSVLSYATVVLDGSDSIDQTAKITGYAWTQTAGPSVTLNGTATAIATFVAPAVASQSTLSFSLTATDTTGATSTANTTVNVIPVAPSDLTVGITSVSFFEPDTVSGHSQISQLDGPLLVGAAVSMRVAMTGAVQSPTFKLVDASGNTLSTPILTSMGSASAQPVAFLGAISVPSVPFAINVSGTTGDGQNYTVTSPNRISPMLMTLRFIPSRVSVSPGASGGSQLTIVNPGAAATVDLSFSDPNSLLVAAPAASVQVGSNSTTTVPISVAYPTTPATITNPAVVVTATVSGDSTRRGSATLTVWELAQ